MSEAGIATYDQKAAAFRDRLASVAPYDFEWTYESESDLICSGVSNEMGLYFMTCTVHVGDETWRNEYAIAPRFSVDHPAVALTAQNAEEDLRRAFSRRGRR